MNLALPKKMLKNTKASPDTLRKFRNITFWYTNKGNLYHSDQVHFHMLFGVPHWDVGKDYEQGPALFNDIFPKGLVVNGATYDRDGSKKLWEKWNVNRELGYYDGGFDGYVVKEQLLNKHIQGRVAYDYFGTLNVIGLWNKTVEQSLLKSCLRDLMLEVHVKEEDLVQFGNNTSQTVSEILNNIPASQAKDDVAPNLHIMMPDQKKAALQRMMGNVGGKKSGWQQGMEKIGAISPGQKWWAATSESFSFKNFLEFNP